MPNPFDVTSRATQRVGFAVVIGVFVGVATFVAILTIFAAVRREAITLGGILDIVTTLGPRLLAMGYAAALLVGWPAYTLMSERSALFWWQFVAIGAAAGFLGSWLVLKSLFAALGFLAGACGGYGAWITLCWPKAVRKIPI